MITRSTYWSMPFLLLFAVWNLIPNVPDAWRFAMMPVEVVFVIVYGTAVRDADLISESVPESMPIKESFWRDASSHAPAHTVFTTNTSTLAPNTLRTKLPHPMPIAISFFAGQGEEPTLIKIGTAYESAMHHRTPPPAFGPVARQLGRTTPSR